jgi:hypothetical protein
MGRRVDERQSVEGLPRDLQSSPCLDQLSVLDCCIEVVHGLDPRDWLDGWLPWVSRRSKKATNKTKLFGDPGRIAEYRRHGAGSKIKGMVAPEADMISRVLARS